MLLCRHGVYLLSDRVNPHVLHTEVSDQCVMVCDQAVSVLQVFLQALEPLADVWQFVKGHPMAANVEKLGLALLERAVWDETLFLAKAVEVEEISSETWAIYPIWRMFSESRLA